MRIPLSTLTLTLLAALSSLPLINANPQKKGSGGSHTDSNEGAGAAGEYTTTYIYSYTSRFVTFMSTPPACGRTQSTTFATTSTILTQHANSPAEATSLFSSLISAIPTQPTNLQVLTVGETQEWYTNPSVAVSGACATVIVGDRAAALGRGGSSTSTGSSSGSTSGAERIGVLNGGLIAGGGVLGLGVGALGVVGLM